jgi:uncharacterized protein
MNREYKKRMLYIKRVKPFIGKDVIKVIIGQRRSGKSYLLYQLMDILSIEYKVKKSDIMYLSKENDEFSDIKTYKDLLNYVNEKRRGKKSKFSLFVDEVQEIDEFEKAIRSLQLKGNCDIYISGSNAMMLSSELATHLAGRYVEIEVFPLSYQEFLEFHEKTKGSESLNEYLRFGGLPYLIHLEMKEEVIYDYLKSVYDSILLKDVVKRYSIRNVAFLENLVSFLSHHIGSLISAKKISDFLKSQRVSISPNIILNYLLYLSSVFFIFSVKRQEIGKKIFETGSKHYFGDLGLRHAIINYEQEDISKILENLVYLQLRVWGYKVYVGSTKGKEIDFVAEKQGTRKYIQVAYLIPDEKTKQREFGNLLDIPDNYEKIVVSMDEILSQNYKGIKHLHIIDFLLSNGL